MLWSITQRRSINKPEVVLQRVSSFCFAFLCFFFFGGGWYVWETLHLEGKSFFLQKFIFLVFIQTSKQRQIWWNQVVHLNWVLPDQLAITVNPENWHAQWRKHTQGLLFVPLSECFFNLNPIKAWQQQHRSIYFRALQRIRHRFIERSHNPITGWKCEMENVKLISLISYLSVFTILRRQN